jgi:hypothetical protein
MESKQDPNLARQAITPVAMVLHLGHIWHNVSPRRLGQFHPYNLVIYSLDGLFLGLALLIACSFL